MVTVCGIWMLHVGITTNIFGIQLANAVGISLAYQGEYVVVVCLSFTVKIVSVSNQSL